MKAKSLKKVAILLGALILVMGFGTIFTAVKVNAAPAKAGTSVSVSAEKSADVKVEKDAATDDESASDSSESSSNGTKAMAAGIAIGLAAGAGALGMGLAVGKANEGISRQPEANGDIRTTLMLGLVFIETAIIYALIIAILIIFVM